MPTLVRRWEPHAAQRTVLQTPARYRILACGRRWGKSTLAAHIAWEYAFHNAEADVWWVAPTYSDANDYGFDNVEPLIPEWAMAGEPKLTAPRELELTNGSTISFRSAEREDSLRGAGLDLLIIDEAGSVPERAWTTELRPTLMDEEAPMVAIGTPKGKNWFHTWFTRGQDPQEPEVASWQSSTYDNPHISDEEIDQTRAEMPQRQFEQEVLAKFVEHASGVFAAVEECIAHDPPDAMDEAHRVSPETWFAEQGFKGPYAIGVDLARTQDFAVVCALDDNGRLAAFERLRDTSWARIQAVIERVADSLTPHTVYIDATRDNKLVQDLQDEGYLVEPVRFTASRKKDLIETLAVRMEQHDIEFPDITPLVNELNAYKTEVTPSGNVRYTAPEGGHDDTVDALALAAQEPRVSNATW